METMPDDRVFLDELSRQNNELVNLHRDIAKKHAELKQAEETLEKNQQLLQETLEKNQQQFQALLESTTDAIYVKDLQGRYILFNRAAGLYVGKSPNEVIGWDDTHVFRPEDAKTVMERDQKVIAEGVVGTYEETIATADGVLRTFLSTKGPLSDMHGNVFGLFGIARDISARKQAEAEKVRLQAQLAHAHKLESVGRLACGVAHDFNNQLTAILGVVDLCMLEPGLDRRMRGWLDEIAKAAEHSANLTRQLLAFSRQQPIAPKAIDINDAATRMLKMLQRLLGEDIVTHWQPGPAFTVMMDPIQLDQILTNLAVNARDAIQGTGTIHIATDLVTLDTSDCEKNPDAMPGNYVRLTFRDTGCGMDRETLAHIFEPFFTTKPVGKGTGLGLATVYGIVKQNGGYITVHSQLGQGTTFEICLPQWRDSAGPVPMADPFSAKPRG